MNHFDAKELSAINQTSPGAECESTVGFDIVGTIRLRCDWFLHETGVNLVDEAKWGNNRSNKMTIKDEEKKCFWIVETVKKVG